MLRDVLYIHDIAQYALAAGISDCGRIALEARAVRGVTRCIRRLVGQDVSRLRGRLRSRLVPRVAAKGLGVGDGKMCSGLGDQLRP